MSAGRSGALLIDEVVESHERYLVEVVERFGLCPWAKQTRLQNRMRTHVVRGDALCLGVLEPVLEDWARDEAMDVGFVIAPRFGGGFDALARFGEHLTDSCGGRFLSAAFHPDASATAGAVRFFRQAPHPTLQLVRRVRLEALRAQDPPHYKDIFSLVPADLEPGAPAEPIATSILARNRQTLDRRGRADLQRILDAIKAGPRRAVCGQRRK